MLRVDFLANFENTWINFHSVDFFSVVSEGGSNVVAGTKYTNANGQTTFKLDAGTYWIHRQLSGYEFSPNPKQETVS